MTDNSEEMAHSENENGPNIKREESNTKMTLSDFLMILVLNLVLPSSDGFSDFAQLYLFAFGLYEPYHLTTFIKNPPFIYLENLILDFGSFNESEFAVQFVKFNATHYKSTIICEAIYSPWFTLVTSVPLILHLCFLLPYWLKIEDTKQKRILTLPLLIMQFWPQYQVLKLLFEKSDAWKKQLKEFERTIGNIGMILVYFHEQSCITMKHFFFIYRTFGGISPHVATNNLPNIFITCSWYSLLQ